MDDGGVAAHPAEGQLFLRGQVQIFQPQVFFAQIVDQRVERDGAVGLQGVEHVLVGQQQGGFVRLDVVDDGLRGFLSQQRKVHHHHTGV